MYSYVGWWVLAIPLRFDSDLDPNTRFSDWDLLMRYHWGQGVGHLHVHQSTSRCIPDQPPEQPIVVDALDDPGTEELPDSEGLDINAADMDDDISDESNNLEFALKDHDVEDWGDVESDTADDNGPLDSESEDDGGIYD